MFIFYNEIAGSEPLNGATIAQQIYDIAASLGKKVIVLNLLCSNPDTVIKTYGRDLGSRNIPVLSKFTDAALAGFWIANCISAGRKIEFTDWLKETTTLRYDPTKYDVGRSMNLEARKAIQTALSLSIMDGDESGCFFQPPRDYIDAHLPDIKPFLYMPGSYELMNNIFPPVGRGKIEAK